MPQDCGFEIAPAALHAVQAGVSWTEDALLTRNACVGSVAAIAWGSPLQLKP